MIEILRHLHGDDLIGLLTVALGISGAFSLFGWKLWLRHRAKELNIELKRDMIAAGMSADEIIRVLEAGDSPKSGKDR